MKKFFCAAALLFLGLAACSRMTIGSPASRGDRIRVEEAYKAMMARNEECLRSLDTEAEISWKSLFESGAITGYLEAMPPAFLKFVGVNPLGQAQVVFATDGERFSYIPVYEGKGYEGDTSASIFSKHAPSGLEPQATFSWLTATLAAGPRLLEIRRQPEEDRYWLVFAYGQQVARHYVLFEPETGLIIGHLLADGDGRIVMEAAYDRYDQMDTCWLPGQVVFTFPGRQGEISVRYFEARLDATLSPEDFVIHLPEGFERIPVQ